MEAKLYYEINCKPRFQLIVYITYIIERLFNVMCACLVYNTCIPCIYFIIKFSLNTLTRDGGGVCTAVEHRT